MTNGDKINYLIELLGLTNKEISEKLKVHHTAICHWKKDDGRLKRVHIYAFSMAYNIPIDIFVLDDDVKENKFDTESKIRESVRDYQEDKIKKSNSLKSDKIIKRLSTTHYYGYNFSNRKNHIDIHENRFVISDDYTISNYNNDDELIREGTVEITEFQSTLKLKSQRTNTYLNIIFDNDRILDNIFYALFSSKIIVSNDDIMGICILSKNKLPKYLIKYLLQNRRESQLVVRNRLKNRILDNLNFAKIERVVGKTPYDADNILKEILGIWNLYIYQTNKSHSFRISADLRVEWYINDIFQERGKVIISSRQSTIEFIDELKSKSYFIFDNIDIGIDKNKIKICSFFSQRDSDHKDIMGIGILSKEKIPQELVDTVLISKEQSILNTFSFRDKLIDVFLTPITSR